MQEGLALCNTNCLAQLRHTCLLRMRLPSSLAESPCCGALVPVPLARRSPLRLRLGPGPQGERAGHLQLREEEGDTASVRVGGRQVQELAGVQGAPGVPVHIGADPRVVEELPGCGDETGETESTLAADGRHSAVSLQSIFDTFPASISPEGRMWGSVSKQEDRKSTTSVEHPDGSTTSGPPRIASATLRRPLKMSPRGHQMTLNRTVRALAWKTVLLFSAWVGNGNVLCVVL